MSSFTEDLVVRVSNNRKRGRTIFILEKAFEYRVGDFENPTEIISIPVGFNTDFMSLPPCARAFIDTAYCAKAAILHDYLLTCGREPAEADAIFKEALAVLGVGLLERNLFYVAVRLTSQIKQLLGQPVY